MAGRTNYALRETLLAERRARPGGPTACRPAVPTREWCRGSSSRPCSTLPTRSGSTTARRSPAPSGQSSCAPPGSVASTSLNATPNAARSPRDIGTFVNTWSVDGFISEGLQPSELGWGTHERWLPPNGHHHDNPHAPSIYLAQPGASTRVRTWCPTAGAQHGLCVTHNESISIADYFTVVADGEPVLPPDLPLRLPCPATKRCCPGTSCSAVTAPGLRRHAILDEADIVDGIDELGVLLYGHARNAYWYGSRLSNAEARRFAPDQNATGLQVTSAVLAGDGVGAGESAARHRRSRRTRLPPAASRCSVPTSDPSRDTSPTGRRSTAGRGLFPADTDNSDPWQFRNVLVR